jgi:P27 family predicted phage terminase small subunit
MARKPTPSAVKRLTGSDRVNEAAPKFDALPADTKPPAVLGRVGRQLWRDLVPLLVSRQLLTPADVALFLHACLSYEFAIEAAQRLRSEGATRLDENGIERKNPNFQLWRDSLATFNRIASEFGLSPSSRERLSIADAGLDEYDLYLLKYQTRGHDDSLD